MIKVCISPRSCNRVSAMYMHDVKVSALLQARICFRKCLACDVASLSSDFRSEGGSGMGSSRPSLFEQHLVKGTTPDTASHFQCTAPQAVHASLQGPKLCRRLMQLEIRPIYIVVSTTGDGGCGGGSVGGGDRGDGGGGFGKRGSGNVGSGAAVVR